MTPKPRQLKSHLTSWRRAAWRAKLETLTRSSAPILVGPWRGEVGFETLYWIPFLDWIKTQGVDPARIIPIGRGGSAAWYGCPQGMELYALRDLKDVRVETRKQAFQSGYMKQELVSVYDRAIVKDAAAAMKLSRYQVLPPAWMYHVLAPFWTGWKGLEWFADRTTFRTLEAPPLPDGVTLPEPFVAVKFYGRETFPWHDKPVRQVAEAVVGTLADPANGHTVLIMDTPEFMDDHMDLPITTTGPSIRRMSEFVTLRPETSLAIQSAVLSKALGFVGTYGGMAQLALRLGKASVSFYQNFGATSIVHKHLSDLIGMRAGLPFQVYAMQEIGLSRLVLPDVVVGAPQKKPHLDTRRPAGVAG